MPWFRIGEPGDDHLAHFRFSRRKDAPDQCRAPRFDGDNPQHGEICGRMAVALCDGLVDSAGVTCSLPMCEGHRTVGGNNIDYCQTHAHMAPGRLPF